MLDAASRAAQGLADLGVTPGDRVALLSENSLAYPVVVFAVAKAGAVLVPLNFRYSVEEITFATRNAEPCALIVGPGYEAQAAQALAGLDPAPELVAGDGSGKGSLAALMQGQRELEPDIAVDPDSAAMIIYTSGTTGFPKGVLFSHRAYLTNHMAIALEGDLRHDDITLVTLPLFHNGGLNGVLLPTLLVGGTAVVCGKGFVAAEQLALVARHRVTAARSKKQVNYV